MRVGECEARESSVCEGFQWKLEEGSSFVHGEQQRERERAEMEERKKGLRGMLLMKRERRRSVPQRKFKPSTWTISSTGSNNIFHLCMHENVCVNIQGPPLRAHALPASVSQLIYECWCVLTFAGRLEDKRRKRDRVEETRTA